ncbi:MAG: substrate-binding domain-containing protein [Capsulimonadaceae bacterium]|nr:substrate-binding domain-containing protein [Capsulimonadaceae bacterium]
MRKSQVAEQVIWKRIARADHVLAGVPSERQLASELGISRDTVRSAVRGLIEQGVLARHDNGRLHVAPSTSARQCKSIAFVSSPEVSTDHQLWSDGVRAALEGHAVKLRPVTFVQWEDPVLHEAMNGFDGIFLVPPPDKMPQWLARKVREAPCRIVVLDHDQSASGIPSVIMFPPESERSLLVHLLELGHKRIDCINTQNENPIIMGRIAVWRRFIEEMGIDGQLRSWHLRRPMETAYLGVRDCLEKGYPLATALLCTTGPAAIGAMRALHEGGLEIGKDVSVCTTNDEGVGRYQLKTLTTLNPPPRALFLRTAVEWMLGTGPWTGPLLVQPDEIPLLVGESTGAAPADLTVVTARKPLS